MPTIDFFKSCPVCGTPIDTSMFHFSCNFHNKFGHQHLSGKASEDYFDWVFVNFDRYSLSYNSKNNDLSIYQFCKVANKEIKNLIKTIRVKDINTWFDNKLEEKIGKLLILA